VTVTSYDYAYGQEEGLEILGAERRRRWSDEDKARIVAESYEEGASVSRVARRHGLSPSQVFAWRKAAREGLRGQTSLIPVTVERPAAEPAEPDEPVNPVSQERIEIILGNGRRLLVPAEIDPKRLRRLVAAVDAP